MYIEMYSDIPSNEKCAIINNPLWKTFSEIFKKETGKLPNPLMWTEAEVVQWLDQDYGVPVDANDYRAIMSA